MQTEQLTEAELVKAVRVIARGIGSGPNRDDVEGEALLSLARGLAEGLSQPELLAAAAKASRRELQRGFRRDDKQVSITVLEHGHYAERPDPGEAVRAAVGQLPGNLRLMMEMHYWEGMTAQEIADLGGFPVRTIERWILEARAKLKKILQPCVVLPSVAYVVYEGGNSTESPCAANEPMPRAA